MTLEEMRTLDREWLSPKEVASVLGCNAQGLRVWAKQCPEQLGFPVIIVKSRVKIPRKPFLTYLTGRCE